MAPMQTIHPGTRTKQNNSLSGPLLSILLYPRPLKLQFIINVFYYIVLSNRFDSHNCALRYLSITDRPIHSSVLYLYLLSFYFELAYSTKGVQQHPQKLHVHFDLPSWTENKERNKKGAGNGACSVRPTSTHPHFLYIPVLYLPRLEPNPIKIEAYQPCHLALHKVETPLMW